jgi:hypothetical protein
MKRRSFFSIVVAGLAALAGITPACPAKESNPNDADYFMRTEISLLVGRHCWHHEGRIDGEFVIIKCPMELNHEEFVIAARVKIAWAAVLEDEQN